MSSIKRTHHNVVLGWEVRKKYVDIMGRFHDKVISQSFVVRSAADTFAKLAEQDHCKNPNQEHRNVSFYVSPKIGTDGLENKTI